MFPCQAYPWKDQCCCGFYLTVAGRTRTSRSARPRGSTDANSHSVATLARNALSTMEISLAPSSARRYVANWTRFVAFVQKLDKKRHYLPASPNTIILFCAASQGGRESTITTCLSAIAERHKAYRYPDPTADYLVLKTVKGLARSRPHVDQR